MLIIQTGTYGESKPRWNYTLEAAQTLVISLHPPYKTCGSKTRLSGGLALTDVDEQQAASGLGFWRD